MKIVVTGSNGQLGTEIVRQASSYNDLQVIPTTTSTLDITNMLSVISFFNQVKPDAVINCAAYSNVDGCESNEEKAFSSNALGARNISVASANIGAKIVQISTDYVFDGSSTTPRREHDAVSPFSVYGQSKEYGERLVRETNNRHFIVRTAWLYGEGNNFVKTILKMSYEKEQLEIVNDQIGTPTSTVELSCCILDLIRTQCYGTYHATASGSCSWFEFAKKIFELKGINVPVVPITTEQLNRIARRPKFSVLENFMLNLLGINKFRPWQDSLEDYLKKI